jgi:hypothetical protein
MAEACYTARATTEQQVLDGIDKLTLLTNEHGQYTHNAIRGYCCQFDLLSNKYMAIVAAIKNLFYFFKKAEQSNADYHEDFMAMLEVIKEYGGTGSTTHC